MMTAVSLLPAEALLSRLTCYALYTLFQKENNSICVKNITQNVIFGFSKNSTLARQIKDN